MKPIRVSAHDLLPEDSRFDLARLDSAWAAVAIVAISYFAFIMIRLARANWDASYFVGAGERYADPHLVSPSLRVNANSNGYDGQFYYRLALDPFTSKVTDFGITFDVAPYRQQRILYPLIVWVTSLGRADWVPSLMIGVNYLVVCGMGWLGAKYARSIGQHALWGLVFPLYPGFLLTVALDLNEILEAGCLLASLWLIYGQRHRGATLLLTLAVLSKETALLAAVAAMLVYSAQAARGVRPQLFKWHSFVIPMATYALYQLVLFNRWGQVPLLAAEHHLGLPFAGFIDFATRSIGLGARFSLWSVLELGFIVILAVAPLLTLHSSRACVYEWLTWSMYGLTASLFTQVIWVENVAYMRALADFFVFGAMLALNSPSRTKRWLCVYSIALWLAYAISLV